MPARSAADPRLSVKVLRGRKSVATRKVTARYNAFRITVRVRRGGSYRAVVTASRGATSLRASTRARRL